MYSAMILSVYGVMSKLSRSSILLTVLLSDFTAKTRNLAELLHDPFLFCFNNRELHIFAVMGLALAGFLVILICHWVEGAKICAIFTCFPLKVNSFGFRLKSLVHAKIQQHNTYYSYGNHYWTMKYHVISRFTFFFISPFFLSKDKYIMGCGCGWVDHSTIYQTNRADKVRCGRGTHYI